MPIITPDFSEAMEFDSTPVPTGVYKARITGVEPKQSAAGNSYLNWKLSIFGAEGEFAKQNNRILFYRTMIDGKASGFLRDFLKAAGSEVKKGEGFDPEALLGKEIEIGVAEKIDERNGQPSPFSEVKAVKSLNS